MKPYILGIPTLNRGDLCVQAVSRVLDGTHKPEHVYIVDNGRQTFSSLNLSWSWQMQIIRPQRNLGVSGSWNLLHRLASPLPLILINDDVFVAPDTCERLMQPDGPAIVTAMGWSCFRQDDEVWDSVGDYDENYGAGYCEDNDYDWRRNLAGVRRVILENELQAAIHHVGSATVKAMTADEQQAMQTQSAKNHAYHRLKWDGQPGQEKNYVPFIHLPIEIKEAISKQWKIPEQYQ